MKHVLIIETSDELTPEMLHESLCKVVHENCDTSQETLCEHVIDINCDKSLDLLLETFVSYVTVNCEVFEDLDERKKYLDVIERLELTEQVGTYTIEQLKRT